MAAVSVVGEALVDLVPEGGPRPDGAQPYLALPGGSPFNVAIGLARLGVPTAMMARLSEDSFGRMLRSRALAAGIDLSAAPHAAEPTTLAVVGLDEQGRAAYDFYVDGTADWHWTAQELTLPAGTRIAHHGSLASWTPPGAALIAAALADARAAGVLVSYDPNVRPRLMGAVQDARALVEASVAASDVVKASDEDLAWLYPGEDPVAVARRWAALGPALVVVTRGADGAVALRPGHDPISRLGRAIRLVDTVGAGDAFTSGLLWGLVELELTAARPDHIGDSQVGHLLERGVLISALTCERAGSNPPSAEEIGRLDQPAE